tara:strand:+ start:385 stop:696 length:312 start_codon:yes stop_codon:yes gene_type:complete
MSRRINARTKRNVVVKRRNTKRKVAKRRNTKRKVAKRNRNVNRKKYRNYGGTVENTIKVLERLRKQREQREAAEKELMREKGNYLKKKRRKAQVSMDDEPVDA